VEPTARGFHFTIAPTTRRATREASQPSGQSVLSLRDELIRILQNPTDLSDDSLFIEVAPDQQRHNNLSTPSSPFIIPSGFLTPQHDSPPASDSSFRIDSSDSYSLLNSRTTPTISNAQAMAQPDNGPIGGQVQHVLAPVYIPGRGEKGAPTVDLKKPRQLKRFFKELEALFIRVTPKTEQEKKDLVLKYVDLEIEEVWERYPEYKNIATSYADFKAAILAHYPDATGDYMYSLADLDTLIGERYRVGIRTIDDLTTYHNEFDAITSWLLEKEHIDKKEQERAYVGAFQPHMWDLIENKLSIKHADRHPNMPYPMNDVYEAARAILQGSYRGAKRYFAQVANQTSSNQYQPFTDPATTSTAAPEPTIKVENFGAIISEFTKTMAEILKQTQSRSNYGSVPRQTNCNMCGGPHFIRECPVVDEYVAAGKCRRNIEGKVVLSTGAFVPREIPGTTLQERIDEWHRRFPGQLATSTLIHTIDRSLLYQPKATYPLTSTDRIAHLEAELFALRTRKSNFVPMGRTRAQTARGTNVEMSDSEDEAPVTAPKKKAAPKLTVVPPATKEKAAKDPEPVATTTQPTAFIEELETAPEHPFKEAKDAAYIPPTERNIGVPIPQAPKKPEPAYKTQPAVYKVSIASDVYARTMDIPITVTQRELLSLSSEVRSQMREATTTRRVPVQSTQEPAVETANFLQVEESDDEDDFVIPSLAIPDKHHRTPPEGSLVIPDPIETYVRSLNPGETPAPDRLIVSCENAAVRSVFAVVDNNRKKECILDSGCQVVTMSKAVSHELGIPYDPTFRISMQSANGELDMSLGLARNVPFKIGPVTFYMQAHVIDSNAYEVLLGRPFDVLTESVVRNFANEDQTITIHDPNSGQKVTIPTLARGSRNTRPATEEDF
jgi:hypothetical protein